VGNVEGEVGWGQILEGPVLHVRIYGCVRKNPRRISVEAVRREQEVLGLGSLRWPPCGEWGISSSLKVKNQGAQLGDILKIQVRNNWDLNQVSNIGHRPGS